MPDGNSSARSPGALRRTVLLGLFAGTAVGAGWLLAGIPNCELVTLICALAGGVLGRGLGSAAGALAATLFSLGNPLGPAPPPLLVAQALGMGAAGWCGGAVARPLLARWRSGRRTGASWLALGTGVGVTLFYDALTSLAGAAAFGLDARVALVGMIPFSAVHVTVNGAQFLLLFPLLLARYHHLGRPPLRGAGPPVAVAACVLLLGLSPARAQAPADSARSAAPAAAPAAAPDSAAVSPPAAAGATAAAASPAPAGSPPAAVVAAAFEPGWPFATTLVERLGRDSFWSALDDGGLGGRVVLAHEPDTSPWPLLWRDGAPLGTGHRWADEPCLAPLAGCDLDSVGYGLDALGGTAGEVRLAETDPRPDAPVVATRFFKGTHLTYLRSLAFRTPRAPWRAQFDFDERLDREGYPLSPPGDGRFADQLTPGASAFRSGRGTLARTLADSSRVAFTVESSRKYRNALPATDTQHEEIWLDRATLDWQGRVATAQARATVFVTSVDVRREWQGLAGFRQLESAREGAVFSLRGAGGRRWLTATVLDWRLHDTGADPAWALQWGGPAAGAGMQAVLAGGARGTWRGLAVEPTLRLTLANPGGWRPGGALVLRPVDASGWWRVDLEAGGRPPRSDELLTADQAAAFDRAWVLAPNPGLRSERVWRAALALRRVVAGTELAFTGSARALRGGIGWTPVAGLERVGRWENDLDLDGATLTVGATRGLDLAGPLRLHAQGAWRTRTVRAGVARGLPPRTTASLGVDWERSVYRGDGVVEFGYRLERVGAYADPWLPVVGYGIEARTLQHLRLGFRLLGADLCLAIRNLADRRLPVSAGALSDGRELRWGLAWTFVR